MGTRFKFNAVLIAVSLLGLAGSGAYMYRFLQQKTIDDVSYHSRMGVPPIRGIHCRPKCAAIGIEFRRSRRFRRTVPRHGRLPTPTGN